MMVNMGLRQGRYKPKYPAKYDGDPTNIIYRSGWELKFMKYCDLNTSVLKWSSEEIVIRYRSPIDGKVHRYFPDFKIKVKQKDGSTKTIIIEVKPKKETREPKPQTRKSKRYIREVMTWGVNQAKWRAAEAWCADRKYGFELITEDDLF